MSCSEQKSAALSGIDWMISYVSWKSRDLPSGGNRFSILAELTDAFCFDEFAKRVSSLRSVKNFLGGRIRRDLAHWSPRWVYNCGEGRGILCSRHKGESLSEICNELPEGVSFQARFFAEERKILFTFSHKITI